MVVLALWPQAQVQTRFYVLQDRVENVAHTVEQTARVYISRSRQTLPRARHPCCVSRVIADGQGGVSSAHGNIWFWLCGRCVVYVQETPFYNSQPRTLLLEHMGKDSMRVQFSTSAILRRAWHP